MNCIKVVAISAVLLGFSSAAMASVVSCSGKTDVDYGDAPVKLNGVEVYGSACNATPEWQRLGSKKTWTAEDSENTVDSGDDGVSWKTRSKKADGTWGAWTSYSTSNTLTQGDQVKFRFKVRRARYGNHQYDLLKAWIDWNGLNGFENDTDEVIVNQKWWKNENSSGIASDESIMDYGKDYKDGNNTWYWNNDLKKHNHIDTTWNKTVTLTIPENSFVGDIWLRARVVCENSLSNHSDNYNLLPTGFQDQGETEDYKITIAKKPVDVPEPSTLFIMALGLFGLAYKRRSV